MDDETKSASQWLREEHSLSLCQGVRALGCGHSWGLLEQQEGSCGWSRWSGSARVVSEAGRADQEHSRRR